MKVHNYGEPPEEALMGESEDGSTIEQIIDKPDDNNDN